MRARLTIPHLSVATEETSQLDGFTKFGFRGVDDKVFETVRIPLLHRPGDEKYIVCVSSQVGCAAGCAFCSTGKMGFKRNLQTWEIVDQVVKVRDQSPFPSAVWCYGHGRTVLNYGA